MPIPISKTLPKEAVLEFSKILKAHRVVVPSEKDLEVLANEFLIFMKIIMKGKNANKQKSIRKYKFDKRGYKKPQYEFLNAFDYSLKKLVGNKKHLINAQAGVMQIPSPPIREPFESRTFTASLKRTPKTSNE